MNREGREVDSFEMVLAPCGHRSNIFVHDASHAVGQGEVVNLCCFECAVCHATWVASQAQASLIPSTWLPGLSSGQVTDEQVALLYGMDKELRSALDRMRDEWWSRVSLILKEAEKWRLKREGALRVALTWKHAAKGIRLIGSSALMRQLRKQKQKKRK